MERAPKKFKNHPRPFFRPRSIHICQLNPNPSGDPVPLKGYGIEPVFSIFLHESVFCIGPLHCLSSRSDFKFEFSEIFVFKNRLPAINQCTRLESVKSSPAPGEWKTLDTYFSCADWSLLKVTANYKTQLYDPRTNGFAPSSPEIGMHVEIRDPDDKIIMSKVILYFFADFMVYWKSFAGCFIYMKKNYSWYSSISFLVWFACLENFILYSI